ncbi:ribokinase [Anaerotruncus massiliensis (ex Togo et al. 2019)]|uniref:ribokinase n=1 Tax=Anaerotruncus TaxID=244127 RepID=UPI000C79487A|nr:ribokinase [Anaerotruncus massiliensis (ex Togo et al. 2019)]
MYKKPKILVVGSFMMDLIVSTGRFPNSGETVIGKSFNTASGGKGANQAVQAARLGADVTMVGKVGDDGFGREMTASVAASGIHTQHILADPDHASGVGSITLEVEEGQKSRNRIIVVPGANMAITPEEVAFLKEEIAAYDMVMLQLEIPMEINELVAKYAYEQGVPVMLNSAPSAPLSAELLSHLSYISPNEHEAADLTGVEIRKQGKEVNRADVDAAVQALLAKGVQNVIITLGSSGAIVANARESHYCPCIDVVEVKDPTAAGDSFVGAYTTAVCAGLTPAQALEFASYAATITVSKIGAQPSLPTLDEVIALMKEQKFDSFDLSVLDVLK